MMTAATFVSLTHPVRDGLLVVALATCGWVRLSERLTTPAPQRPTR